MMAWVVGVGALIVLGVGLALLARRAAAKNLMLLERMRTSGAYHYVQPLFEACRGQRIERVSLRPEAVIVTFFTPVGKRYQCVFEQYGLDPLEAQPLSALAQLAAIDIPELADNRRYFFKRHREPLPGGGDLVWYEYMVQPRYKDSVLRASYDQGVH